MDNPLVHSELLGRVVRRDGVETLGTSSLTLAEQAARRGDTAVAAQLLAYFGDEMVRMGGILFTWIESIATFRMRRMGLDPGGLPAWFTAGIRSFDPSCADRDQALVRLRDGDIDEAFRLAEQSRIRYVALHDTYVVWIQELLAGIARDDGEEAVRESVELARREIWAPRYVLWAQMTPLERLQLSVEGMRGHLSGQRRRGDVGILDEPDRYVMVLDPCGSCGILRRGDPESGRAPYEPAGNMEPHPWTWGRVGVGWYAVHSPIVMEYVQMRDGQPPLRPLEDCDTDAPCRWYIYKDPNAARAEHYRRMGFAPPAKAL